MSENCESLVQQDKCNIEIFLSPVEPVQLRLNYDQQVYTQYYHFTVKAANNSCGDQTAQSIKFKDVSD